MECSRISADVELYPKCFWVKCSRTFCLPQNFCHTKHNLCARILSLMTFHHPALDAIKAVSNHTTAVLEKLPRLQQRAVNQLANVLALVWWARTLHRRGAAVDRPLSLLKKCILDINTTVYETSGQAEVLLRKLFDLDSICFDDVTEDDHRALIRAARKKEVARINESIAHIDALAAIAKRIKAKVVDSVASVESLVSEAVPQETASSPVPDSTEVTMSDVDSRPDVDEVEEEPNTEPTQPSVQEEAVEVPVQHMDDLRITPTEEVRVHPKPIRTPRNTGDWRALFPGFGDDVEESLWPASSPVVPPPPPTTPATQNTRRQSVPSNHPAVRQLKHQQPHHQQPVDTHIPVGRGQKRGRGGLSRGGVPVNPYFPFATTAPARRTRASSWGDFFGW